MIAFMAVSRLVGSMRSHAIAIIIMLFQYPPFLSQQTPKTKRRKQASQAIARRETYSLATSVAIIIVAMGFRLALAIR